MAIVHLTEAENPFGDDPPSKRRQKNKSGTGATAMKHARAIAAAFWPGQPTLEASKRIVWIPGKDCPSCGRGLTPRSMSEDIFGVFDLAVIGFGTRDALIQVTTETASRGTVAPRRRKIEKWIAETPAAEKHGFSTLAPYIEVWAWVRRTHMRRWRYCAGHWRELKPQRSPALQNR